MSYFRTKSQTLPRPPTSDRLHSELTFSPPRPNNQSGKSFSDYEQEILDLKNAMEQLQTKLMEAERKLQNQPSTQDEPTRLG